MSAGIRRGKSFQGSRSKKPNPSGYQGTKVPVSALPDRRRRPVVVGTDRPVGVQLQLAVADPPGEVRNARPVPVVIELVAREVRSRSAIEPCERPLRELDQRREDLAGSSVVLTPEGVGMLTLAVFGVESQPDGFRVLTLVRCETQIPLVSLEALPLALGVAHPTFCRGDDLVPEGFEAVRHVEQHHLGLRPGRESFRRLGQFASRPELAGTLELLLGGTPPGGRVPGQRGQLALDDVLECPLDASGVERAVADTHDDLFLLGDDSDQLIDGGHDDPLPCRRLLRCDLQR